MYAAIGDTQKTTATRSQRERTDCLVGATSRGDTTHLDHAARTHRRELDVLAPGLHHLEQAADGQLEALLVIGRDLVGVVLLEKLTDRLCPWAANGVGLRRAKEDWVSAGWMSHERSGSTIPSTSCPPHKTKRAEAQQTARAGREQGKRAGRYAR